MLRLDVELLLSLLSRERLEALAKDLWIEEVGVDLKDRVRRKLNASDPLNSQLEAFIAEVVWGA